jgi:glutamate carboxypeptidase
MDLWVAEQADAIAARAERELEALVAVSTPSGDREAGEQAAAVAASFAPPEADVERIPCSTAGHADDLLLWVRGTGERRLLLLGHLDTVVPHDRHEPLRREEDRLVGSGSVDMKGGDVLALGVLRALVTRRADLAEAALLLVQDEEWRTGPFRHADRFAGWDACLCFEAGERDAEDREAVVVRRKAAATIRVRATGRSAHSGSQPDRGANALLALAKAAEAVAGTHDPEGPLRLTAVPTILRSGDAFNVVPASGELVCDARADHERAFATVMGAVPDAIGGATLHPELVRVWPGMDTREEAAPLLEAAGRTLGRPVVPASRGGASDASHVSITVPLSIDGLGPRGGRAHAPGEFVRADSMLSRAQVALAVADSVLKITREEST